jgi:hypothetical protein
MVPLFKVLLGLVGFVLITVLGFCGWFFLYAGDLPKTEQLSEFPLRLRTSPRILVLPACRSLFRSTVSGRRSKMRSRAQNLAFRFQTKLRAHWYATKQDAPYDISWTSFG